MTLNWIIVTKPKTQEAVFPRSTTSDHEALPPLRLRPETAAPPRVTLDHHPLCALLSSPFLSHQIQRTTKPSYDRCTLSHQLLWRPRHQLVQTEM